MRFRELTWLTVVVMLAACSADVPGSSYDSAATDTGSSSGGADSSAAPIEGDSLDGRTDVQPGTEILSPDGWGPLRIGMSLAEITAAAGADASPGAVGGADPGRCDEFRPRNAPDGVLVMVESGVLTRISVSRNTSIRTPEGFRIGDPERSVLAEYGSRARVEPHQYWESPAKYITVWRAPGLDANARGVRYEIDANGNVAHLRAGGPSIEYVEGCS